MTTNTPETLPELVDDDLQNLNIVRANRRRDNIIGNPPFNTSGEYFTPQLLMRNLMEDFNRTDWKNLAIKMDYLMREMVRMGGTNVDSNPNIAPILDLFQDLDIPEISEFEKETAGVPSTLTNSF